MTTLIGDSPVKVGITSRFLLWLVAEQRRTEDVSFGQLLVQNSLDLHVGHLDSVVIL